MDRSIRPPCRSPVEALRELIALRPLLKLLAAVTLLAAVAILSLKPPAALACGSPPVAVCLRTTALVKAVPRVIVVPPGGVVVPIPFTVFIGAFGTCPPPIDTTVTFTIACVPGPSPVPASVTILTPAPGVYGGAVPVFFPGGPPRVCRVMGVATTRWTGLIFTTGRGDVEVCLVDPAPGSTTVPRLDMELLSPSIQLAHPGDQRQHVIRMTNNDPLNSVTGLITGTARQNGRMSTISPVPTPGSGDGPGSAASPNSGDAFPIEDADATLPTPGPGNNYMLDDGTAENAIGVAPAGSIIWLNQFTVQPGQEIIDKISVAFGASVDGEPLSVGLWRDLNNDGDPGDAVLLIRHDGVAANAGTNTFNEYPIPPTVPGPVGSSFFVGVIMQDVAFPPQLPAAIDQSSDLGRSWVAADDSCAANAENLSANQTPPARISTFGFPGNWLARARGEPIEPRPTWVQLGDPGATDVSTVTKTITLCPGETKLVRINQRSYRMCTSGSCCETNIRFEGTFSDSSPALACVSPAVMVDTVSQPPDFRCPDGGVMTHVVSTTTNVNFRGNMPTHVIDEHFSVQAVQVIPSGGPPLLPGPVQTGVLDPNFGDNKGRIAVPTSAPGGLHTGTPLQVFTVLEIAPNAPSQLTQLLNADIHPGDPALGDSYFFVNAHTRVTGPGIPPTLDSFFDIFFTVSLDGITGSLHHRGRITPGSIEVQVLGPTTLGVAFIGAFDNDPQLPPLVNQVNVNVDGVGSAFGLIPGPACPQIQTQPADTTVQPGQKLTLYTVASGTAFLSYQWRRNGVPLTNGGRVSGADTATLSISPAISGDSGSYDVVVTNACGSVISQGANVVVRPICPCDFNHDGSLNSQDFFDFLNCFFTPGCTAADFNTSGTVNSQDFFDFLNCFFSPPPGC